MPQFAHSDSLAGLASLVRPIIGIGSSHMLAISPHRIASSDITAAPAPAASRFTLHYLDDTAVLFDSAAQRLYALNATAAYIWSCLEQLMPAGMVVQSLCETFGFPATLAESHVRDVMASRQRLSLVATTGADAVPMPVRIAAGEPRDAEHGAVIEHVYRLLDSVFRLRCGAGVPAYDLVRALRLLRVDAVGPSSTLAQSAISMELTAQGERYTLRIGGAVVDRSWRADQVLPMVKARMVETALKLSSDLFAVHAAAVSRGAACLLIPGASGSGKSTLAAALAADGWRLLGDDTVVLTRDRLLVRPMALPICIKHGSWRLLAGRYPELDAIGTNFRGDGKLARYVLPPEPEPAPKRRVTAVVFPCRTPGLQPGLVKLARPQALTRLVEGLCPLGDELDRHLVERFVRWIESIDCYELRYGELEDGVGRIAVLGP